MSEQDERAPDEMVWLGAVLAIMAGGTSNASVAVEAADFIVKQHAKRFPPTAKKVAK